MQSLTQRPGATGATVLVRHAVDNTVNTGVATVASSQVSNVHHLAYASALTASVAGGAEAISVPTEAARSRAPLMFAVAMFVVGAALVAAETAITTLWPWKVRELAEKEGETSPFAVLDADLTRFLTTTAIATTASTVFSTAIATELFSDAFGAARVAYFTSAITVFFLFFGEILPKALAVRSPAGVARVMVPAISVMSRVVYPLGRLLASISAMILRALRVPSESDAAVSEEELRLIVAGADRSGSIEKHESQIIQNVLDLEEKDVREVMCPRTNMVAVAATDSLADLLKLEADSRYSRMPVFDASIDNIIGIVIVKTMLRYMNSQAQLLESTQVAELMDPAFFVPESMSVWVVLEEMRKRRIHMAIVVDEYGGTAGLVTLEDILEEVVGEIYDEDDDFSADEALVEKLSDSKYRIDGKAELQKVLEVLELSLPDENLNDYGTLSGLLCELMGGIPENGDNVIIDQWGFSVLEADERRIIRVEATLLPGHKYLKMLKGHDDDVDSSDPLQKLMARVGNGVSETENRAGLGIPVGDGKVTEKDKAPDSGDIDAADGKRLSK